MDEQRIARISVTWRGRQLDVDADPSCTVKEFGQLLQDLTNVKPETLKLIVPQSANKGSKLISPFSEPHSSLTLKEAAVSEGKPIRMMGVFEDEIEEVSDNGKRPDMRIIGFEEEEQRLRQRSSGRSRVSLKLPQGQYIFCDFRTLHLPGVELNPPPSEALKRMHMLACDPGIIAIMNKHRWRVGIMTEMAPVGYVGVSPKCILGFNKNMGEEISLRLRTDDLKGFRKYESIKKTLLHELAHMVHSEHDAHFFALNKQLNEEAASLDWTKSSGHVLSGRKIFDSYEDEFDLEPEAHVVGHKLGGGSSSQASAHVLPGVAAYQRLLSASSTDLGSSHSTVTKSVERYNVQGTQAEPDPDDAGQDFIQENAKAEPDPDDNDAMPIDVTIVTSGSAAFVASTEQNTIGYSKPVPNDVAEKTGARLQSRPPHSPAMAGAVGFLADVNDNWLKPRLLRVVVGERMPQPGSTVPPEELASILEAVRTHGLLSEVLQDPSDQKLAEAWRATVDAWVERVGELVESDSPYSCWLGTCFLGVTFQECSSERFAESYSDWFEKILRNLQGPSSLQLVTVVSCTSMSDLFARLAKFLNLKKEASSFAGRVVEPLLLLLNENGQVVDEAIELLRTVIKFYPSSVNRHYNKVESTIGAKIMSTEVNAKLSKKFARVLAMLPSVRVSEGTWSLMIQKVLMGIHNLLNDAFVGLEEEKKGREIMMLLVPPGNDPPPVLGDQVKLGGNLHVTKKFRVFTVPTISALAHCCCMMLTSYYPVQVTVPVRALIALSRRVLLVDGSLRNKSFPSTTSLHQELICFALPSLHSSFLDLLHATIKGMRSQLLPHAANIVRLVTDYFKVAKLPTTRTKVYSIFQLLLTSMGVGMSLHLLEVIVSNAVGDLDDNCVEEMPLFSTNPSKGTSESSSKSYSKKRKQEPQIQNSHASGLEKAAISPKKMKTSSMPTSSKGMTPETPGDVRMFTPLYVKIAALETLEILLNVGGSLRTDHWRAKVDLLLINIATSACDSGAGYEPSTSKVGETSISDFRLASLKALLASFLSSPHARPLYLAQGTELFRKGKLEIGTMLAEFCSHALLALDVLTHPRALSLEKAGPLVPGLDRSESEKAIFGAGTFYFSPSEGQRQVIAGEDTYDDWLPSIKDNEPTENSTPVKEVPQIDSHTIAEAVEDVPACNRSDAITVVATTEETSEPMTVDNPSSSNAVSNPIYSRPPETQKAAATPFREETRRDHVDSLLLQNKSSAVVNLTFRNLATSGEKPSDPGVATLNSYKDVSLTRFIQPIKADLSDTESGDSMPEIQDGDPDSDY